jgi:hypothetical protein
MIRQPSLLRETGFSMLTNNQCELSLGEAGVRETQRLFRVGYLRCLNQIERLFLQWQTLENPAEKAIFRQH